MVVMTTSKILQVRLTDKVKPWIVKALKEFSPDEVVIWDLAINAYPNPSATVLNGDSADPSEADSEESYGLIPALVLYLEIPGATPETSIYGSPILPPFTLDESIVRQAVEQTLESLRKGRADQALTLSQEPE